MLTAINTDLVWDLTLDSGQGSVFPDYPSRLYAQGRFARIPFITGTNQDEGVPQIRKDTSIDDFSNLHIIGTFFALSQEVTDPELRTWIEKQHSPPTLSQQALDQVADRLLQLYPDDPALGSPFGTGAELFGLPSSYKRRSALGTNRSICTLLFRLLIAVFMLSGRHVVHRTSPPMVTNCSPLRHQVIRLSLHSTRCQQYRSTSVRRSVHSSMVILPEPN